MLMKDMSSAKACLCFGKLRRGCLSPCSTPQLLAQNPTDVSAVRFLDTVLFPAARICHGEDSSAILSLKNIDLASM